MGIEYFLKNTFVFLLVIASSSVRADSDLVKGMVYFEQVYVPVLALTSVEKVGAARKAMASLDPVWKSFKDKYYSKSKGDSQWKADFDKVEHYIEMSKKIISRGSNIKDAHEELEHVRVVFMNLRVRHNIEYFIDHLTRYHEPMEEIVLAVKGKTESTLSEKDLSIIQSTLPEAKKLWHVTSNAKFDASLYDFSNKKTIMFHELVEKEKIALQNLEKALKGSDKNKIIQAGLAIKPNFAKLFKSFGHFPEN